MSEDTIRWQLSASMNQQQLLKHKTATRPVDQIVQSRLSTFAEDICDDKDRQTPQRVGARLPAHLARTDTGRGYQKEAKFHRCQQHWRLCAHSEPAGMVFAQPTGP